MSGKIELTPYEKVLTARKSDRPDIMKYIDVIFDDFIELHGDRYFKDDKSLVAGIAMFHQRPVTVIGNRKGKNTQENITYNFGMASPEGYRKAVRLMKEADKFDRPVIAFVDTPGAYPGMEAESNGQSNAIAGSIATMLKLSVPVISIITGEGGSGGALALAAADRVYMLENAVYSILSPEGFASIIYKDAKKAPEASEIMKLTADELYGLGLVDGIIPEGDKCFSHIERMIDRELATLSRMKKRELVNGRYDKFRNIDKFNKRK
ncbi:MAG: acetyl-CoA carboxylase carboxyltransferase subunit alpha [Lachnospira sp.]